MRSDAAPQQTLAWRPLAVSDAAALADLLNAVDAEDHVWGQYTMDDAAAELGSPIADLPSSTLAVFDGPTMLGFSAAHYEPDAEDVHRVQAAGAVRPTHRRHGLGTTLLGHGLQAARTLHARHHPDLRLVVECLYGEHVHGAAALYRAAGMTATRWSRHMRHPLDAAIPVVPIPDGMRLEGYTALADEEFRAVRNDAFGATGSAPLSPAEWQVWATNASFRPELSFLLRDVRSGRAAGIVLTVCWEGDAAATGVRDAHLRVVATRPGHRGRGIARALVSHTLLAARAAGYGRASLRVTDDGTGNGSGFARRAGFVVQDTQVSYCVDL